MGLPTMPAWIIHDTEEGQFTLSPVSDSSLETCFADKLLTLKLENKSIVRTVLLLFAISQIAQAQSSWEHTRNPTNVSYLNVTYSLIWNLIQEYDDIDLPYDLRNRFDGYQFSVAIGDDGQGHRSCGNQPILRRRAVERGLHVSDKLLQRLATPVCDSIKTWKIRPLLVDGRPVTYFGTNCIPC
jgi:hypothetical protein